MLQFQWMCSWLGFHFSFLAWIQQFSLKPGKIFFCAYCLKRNPKFSFSNQQFTETNWMNFLDPSKLFAYCQHIFKFACPCKCLQTNRNVSDLLPTTITTWFWQTYQLTSLSSRSQVRIKSWDPNPQKSIKNGKGNGTFMLQKFEANLQIT